VTLYWLLFLVPALLAIVARPVAARNVDGTVRGQLDGVWIFIGVALTVLIGFRFEVGGDWFNYLRHFNFMNGQSYAYALSKSEFSHWVVNKVMNDLGLGLKGVNFLYALFFTVGLVAFARVQPRPWLVLACAVPYLIIVVAMGYSRQAVALGFAFIGIVALRRGRFILFSLWVLVGATFHNSAVLLIPIAGLAANRNRMQAVASVGFISILGYELLLSDNITRLVDVYIDQQLTSSQGALIRLSMNALAALIFLNFRRLFALTPAERRLWSLTSLIALAMFLAYFATGLSTALDRLALYFIPLQLVTAAHLPDALGLAGRRNSRGVIIVLAYFLVVHFVWLNFASHAPLWLPYQIRFVQ
jgi:hypothetical protein